MLVLTRKIRQSLIIRDDIKVTFLGEDQGIIRFGIIAPKNISVHREEIYDLIQKERCEAQDPQDRKNGSCATAFNTLAMTNKEVNYD